MTNSPFAGLKPLPGEFAMGHAGRIGRVNAFMEGWYPLAKALSEHGHRRLPIRQPTVIHTLAKLAEMEAETYASEHSLVGISAFRIGISGDLHSWTALQACDWRTLSHNNKWCTDCAQSDRDRYGFSYWRRDHQVPGQLFCETHHCVLQGIESDDAFLLFPHECKRWSKSVSQAEQPSAASRVGKYHRIINDMLRGPSTALLPLLRRLQREELPARPASINVRLRVLHAPRWFAQATFSEEWVSDVMGNVGTACCKGAVALAVYLSISELSVTEALAWLRTTPTTASRVSLELVA